MILIVDATERDTILLGFMDGKKMAAASVPISCASFDILGSAVRFLQRHSYTLADVRTIIATAGPGRFSGLRLTSVLANTLQWSKGVKLRMIRGKAPGETPKERILYMQKHASPAKMVKPFYGKPPSITKPKKSS